MKNQWHTVWQGPDIVVYRNDAEVDRFTAADVQRVVFVHRNAGDTPGDLSFALVELHDDCLVLPAETGFAGRVHFERLSFWAEKQCIFWTPEAQAPLPSRLRRGLWPLFPGAPMFRRVPKSEISGHMERWPLTGPQTWEERKWLRIELSRPFGRVRPVAEAETLAQKRA